MKTVKHMLAMIQLVLILIMGAPRKQEQRQQGSSSQLQVPGHDSTDSSAINSQPLLLHLLHTNV